MRFSTAWLQRYVDLPGSVAELGDLLSGVGLLVEEVEEVGADTVVEVEVPTNRVDAMCHLGLAREIAAARRLPLRPPPGRCPEEEPAAADLARVSVADPQGCPRYAARVVVGASVGPSPPWLAALLEAVGLRPVNNVVDVTNFVLWELGHPLHAFDLDRLAEQRIVVRRARAGEALTTLDGVPRSLTPEDLVIADAREPVALAGIMGGVGTAVEPGASRVLLEGAWFDPLRVRRTARRLGLHTDASHRFERSPAIDGMVAALDRAAALLAEIAGGRVCAGRIDVASELPSPRRLALRTERLRSVLGAPVPAAEARGVLERLGFRVEAGAEGLQVEVPAFRGDVTREADLIEEVARHLGYDRLPATLPALPPPEAPAAQELLAERRLRQLCAAAGFWEAHSIPLTSRLEQAPFLAPGQEPVALSNPLSEAQAVLRAHLVPGLLAALARNRRRGVQGLRLFEVGRRFSPAPGGAAPAEPRALALVACGPRQRPHWDDGAGPVGLYDLKGVLDTIAARMGWPPWSWSREDRSGLAPGRAARLAAAGAEGWAGQVDPDLAAGLDIGGPVWVAEVEVETLLSRRPRLPRYHPLPRHPGGVRDLSLLLPERVPYAQVAAAVAELRDLPLAGLQLLDVYLGPDLPRGHRSLTLRLTYRAPDRTLTAEEIEAAHHTVAHHLERRLGARRR